MLVLLSPSKKLDTKKTTIPNTSSIDFREETLRLVEVMKKRPKSALKKMMGLSDKLAELNVQRYQEFSSDFNEANSNAAVFEFRGDVFTGLEADTMSDHNIEYAQAHLRILSGLYGLLKPKDLIQPYRLEMGSPLRSRVGKTLYSFWGTKITDRINEQLTSHDNKILFNLASNEYGAAVQFDKVQGEVIHFGFKEWRNEQWKFISFSAKKARGLLARFIIDHQIEDKESIKAFDVENYTFNTELSSENEYFFTR